MQLTVPQQSALHRHTVELRSEHHIAWRLLQTDLDRISETTNLLTTFKPVGLDEYRKLQNQVQVGKTLAASASLRLPASPADSSHGLAVGRRRDELEPFLAIRAGPSYD